MIFFIIEAVIFVGLLALDLVSKHFIMPYLEAHGDLVLIDKVLTLTPAYNTGAGFSMLSGKTGLLIAITVVGLLAIVAIGVYAHLRLDMRRHGPRFLAVTLVMMLSGGVGNLVDRIMLGKVRDFIDYTVVETLFHRSFAICNLADVWLTVGMVFLIVYIIFFMREGDKKGTVTAPDPYQVQEAERLLAVDKARTVDPRQVILRADPEVAEQSVAEDSAVNGAEQRDDAADGAEQGVADTDAMGASDKPVGDGE